MQDIKHAPSWGRLTNSNRTLVPFSPIQLNAADASRLPYGNGRSYGDSCHNDQGILLNNRHQNSILSLDFEQGIMLAQSGILLSEILDALKYTNWFLPVVPGTRLITLGGALANDIHGKNHGHKGTIWATHKPLYPAHLGWAKARLFSKQKQSSISCNYRWHGINRVRD